MGGRAVGRKDGRAGLAERRASDAPGEPRPADPPVPPFRPSVFAYAVFRFGFGFADRFFLIASTPASSFGCR